MLYLMEIFIRKHDLESKRAIRDHLGGFSYVKMKKL